MQGLEVVHCRAEAPQYLAPSTSAAVKPAASMMLESLLVFKHSQMGNCGFGPQMTAAKPEDNPSPVAHEAHSSCLVHS